MKEGKVWIHQADGTMLELDESAYIESPANNPYTSDIIPPDCYFVLGDNRNNSNDSRGDWVVARDDIVGKAWFSIWPTSSLGLAPNYSFP